MSTIDINCHLVNRITAKPGHGGSSTWLDLTIANSDGEIEITLFPADHDDPRFAALAKFIAETWTAEEKMPTEPAPAVDKADDMPF